MFHKLEKSPTDAKLWIIIKLSSQRYAIDSSYVESISQLTEPISVMPESTNVKPGIIHVRGNVIPLINMRAALGLKTLEEEQAVLAKMLEQRKLDHIHWVEEMERCLDEEDTFTLATDPHKCAFGKWYDNFHTNNQILSFHLKKIDEPHKKLHKAAHLAFECPRECDDCEREKCLREELKENAHIYKDIVVKLLDEAKTILVDNARALYIVVRDQKNDPLGLLIDEVLAVETIKIKDLPPSCMNISGPQLVSHVGEKENSDTTFLVLNINGIYSL